MNRRSFLAASLASVTGVAYAQTSSTVVLGNVSLSFYSVTGAVVKAVLQRLGHRVEVREGLHEEIFPLLNDSAIDLMAAAWLPEGHAAYWARYGENAVEVARLYEGARFFWAVPDYVPQADVASIDDLTKPDVAGRMAREIHGIGPGATISSMSQRAIVDYELGVHGYSFRSGTQASWIETYRAAVRLKRWIVFPTWAPQFLNRDNRLRPLQDPRGTFGDRNHASLVGPQSRVAALPERTRRALARIELDIDAVTEMDWLVNERDLTAQNAAHTWMTARESRVRSWLDGAQ